MNYSFIHKSLYHGTATVLLMKGIMHHLSRFIKKRQFWSVCSPQHFQKYRGATVVYWSHLMAVSQYIFVSDIFSFVSVPQKKQRLPGSHSREGRSSAAAIRCRLRLQEHSEPGAEAETRKVNLPLCRSDGMSVRSETTPLELKTLLSGRRFCHCGICIFFWQCSLELYLV